MTPQQTESVAERLREITKKNPTQAGLFRRVYHDKPSKAAAIKGKCLDCCCWQRVEVRLCTTIECPLWRVRPFQPKGRNAPPCAVDAQNKRVIESRLQNHADTPPGSIAAPTGKPWG